MKKGLLFILIVLMHHGFALANRDSILTFSNLKFHSEDEQNAFANFVQNQSDTLNAFLFVDEIVTQEDAVFLTSRLEDLWKELESKKIRKKKVNAQINLIYSTVKKNYLLKYDRDGSLSFTILNGRYNESTAAIMLAILFDRLRIPYLLLDGNATFSVIANPGPNEVKLEVGSLLPTSEKVTPEYRKSYIDNLILNGKMTSDDLRFKTYDELYEEKISVQEPITLKELLGKQYYTQSIRKWRMDEFDNSLQLVQKSMYLFPAPYVQVQVFHGLTSKIDRSLFFDPSDIDYLVQYNRIGNLNIERANQIFRNVFYKLMRFEDKGELMETMFHRYINQIDNQELKDEVSFTYYSMRCRHVNMSYPDILYADKAAYIKSNMRDLNALLESLIRNHLQGLPNDNVRIDSIQRLSNHVISRHAKDFLETQRLITSLRLAKDAYKDKQPALGEKYLKAFESACPTPIQDRMLINAIESNFREIAVFVYWKGNGDYIANNKMIERGLKYVPESTILKGGTYDKGFKYVNTNPEVQYLKKGEKEKPKTGRTIRVISKDKKEKVYSL